MAKERQLYLDSDIPDLFSSKDLQLLLKVDKRTAQRYIQKWLKNDLIFFDHKEGQLNYYCKIDLRHQNYNKYFIDGYIPNKTSFFSKSEITQLQTFLSINPNIDLETYTLKIYERLMIDLSWASSRLEGNTYSLLETEKLLISNEEASGKNLLETQMILNHKEAIKFIVMNRKEIMCSSFSVKSIHALLSDNILTNLDAMGVLRKIPVGISGTDYTPINIPQLIEEEFDVFIQKWSLIKDPIEQSFFSLVFIPYIQPFEDLNKRTSRISSNISLIKNKKIPISFKNIETEEYIVALKDIYEFNNVEKMKNLFIKAAKDSSRDYSKVISTLKIPTKNSIKYRLEIKKIIHDVVANLSVIDPSMLDEIPSEDRDEVYHHIKTELEHLNEGSIIRFSLTPKEFKTWKKSISKYSISKKK